MSAEEQQKKDEYYMRWALKEAEAAYEEGEIPIGAIVVCRGRIIARAHNMTETLHDVTAHAEMQAITMAADQLGGKYLSDCTLYITVEPCPMWCPRMVADTACRLWSARHQARLQDLRSSRATSKDQSNVRRSRRQLP